MRAEIRDMVREWATEQAGAPWAQQRDRAPAHARDRIDDAIVYLVLGVAGPALQAMGAPTYDAAAARAMGDGDALRALAPDLTERERQTWARQDEHADPRSWLVSRLGVGDIVRGAESIPVVRWVVQMMAREDTAEAMRRPLTVFGDHVDGRPLDRLDELEPQDLSRGVVATFARAAQRRMDAQWDGPEELAEAAPWMASLPEGVRPILTWSALWAEGLDMRHCVASYAADIARGDCSILSVRAPDGTRSTVEVRRGLMGQHCGPCNAPPSSACAALVGRLALGLRAA